MRTEATFSSRHRRAHRALAASVVALVVLVAGCGGDDDDAAPSTTTATAGDDTVTTAPAADAASTTTAAADAADFPRTVEHALGTAEVAAEPSRVVALDMSLVDAALTLELPLVGYTTYDDPNGSLPDYFGDAIDAHAADATWVGDLLSPNLEAIVELEPDLILTAAVRHETIYDELAAIAPTIATESAGGGWKDNIRLTAEATGREDLAAEKIGAYEERAAGIGAAINDAHDDPTISVVRFLDHIRLYQPVSFSGVVLADAGLARPESQQSTDEFIRQISEEEIGLADADVLFYTVRDDADVEQQVAELQARPLWSSLGAVQNDSAYPVPDETWMSATGMFGAHEILDDLADIFTVEG
ncbi:MAG: iron-siderophore ABC transporter substrate-binding protein [Actinomycetota bacterium]|nr:iron-siderophore ABC transporter substrate-binding protein [Actinomycetota bacterium]